MKSKRLIFIFISVVFLLLIPFIAMQFTNEVAWTSSDFVAMGILLLGTGLLCELVWRKAAKTKYRITLIAVVIAIFLLIWIEPAVGVFGTPFGGR